LKLSLFLTSLLLAGTASANIITTPTITDFSIVQNNESPFSTLTLTSSFAGNVARVTDSTVSCSGGNETPCSGTILSFTLTAAGLPAGTAPFGVTIDGNLSGISSAGGILSITSPGSATIPFVIGVGDFATTIVASSVPSIGSVTVTGSLSLTLAPGQTLTLPSSLQFTVGDVSGVPEPGTFALTGVGLVGLLAAARKRLSL
jgi:hypothetical protein